jgi:hypothetical protein
MNMNKIIWALVAIVLGLLYVINNPEVGNSWI